jgi:uncharacterized protein YbjT (DUF2867 family)
MPAFVFITGSTGYIGRALVPALAERGHRVRALVRAGSESKAPAGGEAVVGDALSAATFAHQVAPADTFIQLVGEPRPAPWKARAFERVDLVAGKAGIDAARAAGVRHFVYVSVAQPAPVMRAYQRVRAEVERYLATTTMDATILRPWYMLGPGHWWPSPLLPLYAVARRTPGLSDLAQRCGLLRLDELVAAMVSAVGAAAHGRRVLDVPAIRAAARAGWTNG